MRRLTTIATAPFIRPDGSICETRGYDAACSVFYQPNADFSAVPANPTRKDAERALAILLEPFSEFPFANDAARSAFAAHILTEIVRPAINTSPAFFYTAPTPGDGQDPAVGNAITDSAWPRPSAASLGRKAARSYGRTSSLACWRETGQSDSIIYLTVSRSARLLSAAF